MPSCSAGRGFTFWWFRNAENDIIRFLECRTRNLGFSWYSECRTRNVGLSWCSECRTRNLSVRGDVVGSIGSLHRTSQADGLQKKQLNGSNHRWRSGALRAGGLRRRGPVRENFVQIDAVDEVDFSAPWDYICNLHAHGRMQWDAHAVALKC